MELLARNMHKHTPEKRKGTATASRTAGRKSTEEAPAREGTHYSITVLYDTLLYDTLQNMIRSSHTAQDFTYTSLADFVRAALKAYQGGMPLTELDRGGAKIETSLRVDRELWTFYKGLPSSMRSKILERAIRTFMKQQQETTGQAKTPSGRPKKRTR